MIKKVAPQFEFGQILRHFRERRGLSARSLSQQAHLSPSYVSKVERGDFLPRVDAYVRLMAVLQVTDLEMLFLLHSANSTD